MKKIQYKENDFFPNTDFVFIKDIGINEYEKRMGLFKCFCGKEFKAIIQHIKNKNTKSCGCLHNKLRAESLYKHGFSGSLEYQRWICIKDRIFNPKNKKYKIYGGRGITIFPPWIHDFTLFHDYVSALPGYGIKGLTLDRIDTNGNYEPCNLRWTTFHVQTVNRRIQKSNTSGYVGVSKHLNRWQSEVGDVYIGCYATKELAVVARNNYIIANNLAEYKIQEVRL